MFSYWGTAPTDRISKMTTANHKYANKVQVVLETRKWNCGTCNHAATFNAIEGHDIAFHLARYTETIAWFKANYDCCAKAGA